MSHMRERNTCLSSSTEIWACVQILLRKETTEELVRIETRGKSGSELGLVWHNSFWEKAGKLYSAQLASSLTPWPWGKLLDCRNWSWDLVLKIDTALREALPELGAYTVLCSGFQLSSVLYSSALLCQNYSNLEWFPFPTVQNRWIMVSTETQAEKQPNIRLFLPLKNIQLSHVTDVEIFSGNVTLL